MTRDEDFGRRIATARKARRLTQAQLATRAAISASLLTKIERGVRPVTPSVSAALERVLGFPPLRPGEKPDGAGRAIGDAVAAIRTVVDCHDVPDDGPVRTLGELTAAVHDMSMRRLASQYRRLADTLPDLLAELARAAQVFHGQDQQKAFGLLAMAYRAADGVAYKWGYLDLSARIIELMRAAVRLSADPLLAGMAEYVRTEIFFANQNLTAGLHVLDRATASMDRLWTREALAVYGSLQMRAAVVAARAGRVAVARSRLDEAREVAGRVRESVYYGTAFGPSSVRVHDVAVAVELGDDATAVARAGAWQPPRSLPAERRSHYFIDLARAHTRLGRRPEALAALQFARRIAPQHTRHNPLARQSVATLVQLARHPSDELLAFASWAHAI